MKVKTLRNYLIFGYIVALIGGTLYVSSVLEHTKFKELDKTQESVEKIQDVNVSLILELNNKSSKYEVKLSTKESVNDLLENLRDNDKIFFEKIGYIYGNELEELNHQKTPEGYKWKLFLNNEDITYKVDDIHLTPNATYILKLVKQ